MARRSEMFEPSFRGVKFNVTQSEGEIGRRNVINEFPDRDDAEAYDLGRKARVFTLTCFVVGSNYIEQRNALEEAFEKAGPGELIHPWRGAMNVVVSSCRPSESIDQLGRYSWSVTFTQTGNKSQPSVRPDTVAIVDAASDKAIAATENDFSQVFNVDAMPEFVELDSVAKIGEALDNTLAIARGMLPDMTIVPAFISNASGILGKITELMRLPTNLATEMTSQTAGILGLGSSPLASFNALKNLFGFSHAASSRATPSRIQLDNNRIAIADITRRAAVIEAARSSASIEYESQNQAILIRDSLVVAIEAEELTASDDVFNALAELRTAVVNDISVRASDLARLIPYTPNATLPALVVAYSLYGDANRDTDIINRNRIGHPGFIVGGKSLEVLTD